MEKHELLGLRVITTSFIPYWEGGKGYRPGKIVSTGEKIGDCGALQIELEPIGRERKPRFVVALPNHFVFYTDADAEKIRAHVNALGLAPQW